MPSKTFFRLRDEKQEAIIRSAIREFTANGFAGAKIGVIAEKAEIAKGSVYQYFENKEELFIHCAKWGLDVFMKKINERVNLADMDVFDYFRDNSAQLEVMREEQELAAFMQTVMNEKNLLDESMQGMYDVGEMYTKTLIQNGIKRGTVRGDIAFDLLLEYFYAVTERFSKRWTKHSLTGEPSGESIQAARKEVDCLINLLKNGMGC